MSSSAPSPTQTPTQIFAHLMATGAIDRFRKSLEKLIQPLSQARHQSISKATDSFLNDLISADDIISNPKQLLTDAKHATMTSVREDVIKDVQQTAVSEAADEFRRALRHAFDSIISPPKERSEPTAQRTETSPPQAQSTREEPSEPAKPSSSSTEKETITEQQSTVEAPKQTMPMDSQTSKANSHALQQSERSPIQEADFGVRNSPSITNQSASLEDNTSPTIQTIPTDLFQTAHDILELKAKEKEAKASLAVEKSSKGESTQTQAAEERSSPLRNDAVTPELGCGPTPKPSGDHPEPSEDHEGVTTRSIDSRNSRKGLDIEEQAKMQEGDPTNDGGIDQVPSQTPETSVSKDFGRETKATKLSREMQSDAKELEVDSNVEAIDVKVLEDNDIETPKTPPRRGRKRRKPPAKLVVADIGTRKRRRKSQVPQDAVVDSEEGTGKRKRGRKETESAPSKRPRKARIRHESVANLETKRMSEKRSGRKRGKGSEIGLNPAVAALIDPENPNRPRGYEVSEPSCIPEDYEVQARVLQILENLLEHDCSTSFAEPVDLGDEGQSSYLREIKNPMDLGTIAKRLREGTPRRSFFKNVNEVLADIELVWWNCARFNGQFDPVVQDMTSCRDELSNQVKRFVLSGENGKTTQGPSATDQKTDMIHDERREENSEADHAASNTRRKQGVNRNKEDPEDLNNGQLLGKQGVIFRYVEGQKGGKRKEWSLCTVTEYDGANKSYTLLWADESETRNATIGAGCMFNIHRFRTV